MKRTASVKITAPMAAHIRYLMEEAKLYQHQIAAVMGVNQGRISEVNQGKRHPGVRPARGPFPV